MTTEKNLQKILDLMQRDDSVDAPTDSIRWASNLFRTRVKQPKHSLVKRISAILQMEIAPGKPAFGERSASASKIRQMLFRADDNAIDIRVEPSKKGFTIRGQVLGTGFERSSVTLSDDSRTMETQASDASEFQFDNVAAGRYELVVRGEGLEISLRAIDVE